MVSISIGMAHLDRLLGAEKSDPILKKFPFETKPFS